MLVNKYNYNIVVQLAKKKKKKGGGLDRLEIAKVISY